MRKTIILLLLSSCSYKYPLQRPTAKFAGDRSTTTSLRYNLNENSFTIYWFDGYVDSKVIGYRLRNDTVNTEFFNNQWQEQVLFEKYKDEINKPNGIWVSPRKLIDETEIANIHWAEFLHYVKRDSSENLYTQMLPDESQLPREDYFINPFFRYYPVVGITYEQAEMYCKWRTKVVNEVNRKLLQSKGITPPKSLFIEFRLPTEKEWETIAACGNDFNKYPQGTKNIDLYIRVKPKASGYLKYKNELNQSPEQIKSDIKKFNKLHLKVTAFNIDRPNAPYFLTNKTPFYVYDFPRNNYGIHSMIGNVAELVQEKGIIKGGSYLDKLEDCTIERKGKYTGASPTVGFRAISEIKYE